VATRLYLTSAAAPVTPADATYSGGTTQNWEYPATPGGMLNSPLKLAHTGNWPGATAFTRCDSPDEQDANLNDVCAGRFVSDALSSAQTITGTLKGQMQHQQDFPSANAVPQMFVKVISNDGSTVRGTLWGGLSSTSMGSDVEMADEDALVPPLLSGTPPTR
jgi:hypothetical protein